MIPRPAHHAPGATLLPWAIYARLSRAKVPGKRDRAKDETVERQRRECRAYAKENNYPISEAHIYIDNHLSAWKPAHKGGKRPAYDAMMAAAWRGELAGILIWKLDRFTRAPRDMEDLIDLAEKHSVHIAGPMSGFINLTTAAGRQQARGAANQAASESDNTSERARAANAEARAEGLMLGGPRCFGFAESSSSEHNPAEVAVLREAARRVLDGESLRSVARDLAERGVRSVNGQVIDGRHLAVYLKRKRYGGLIEHRGKVVGQLKGEPVFDEHTFQRLQALFTRRRVGRQPTEQYLLSGGFIQCGKCITGRLHGHTDPDPNRIFMGERWREYRCEAHLGIPARAVEELVRDKVLAVLADPLTRKGMREHDKANSAERDKWQAELDEVNQTDRELEINKARGPAYLDRETYDAVKPILVQRREAATAALAALDAEDAGGTVPVMTREMWDAATMEDKRVLIRQLRISVIAYPWQPGMTRNRFDPRRLVVKP